MAARTETRPVSWDYYDAWAVLIVEKFFSGQARDRLVYLDLSDDTLRDIGRRIPQRTDDAVIEFTRAVVATLDIERARGSTFRPHVERLRQWKRSRSTEAPPCVALLGFLALIAEGMAPDEQFAGNNYYGRLAKRLGVKPEGLEDLIRNFRSDTPQLWGALNQWLEDQSGGRGLPTAYAFDHRRFVGLPISQALIRAADRERLIECFTVYGLRGGQRISAADMARLLAEWIPAATLSSRLRTLWATEHAREQIAEIACRELEAWDGVAETDGPSASAQAVLLACDVQRVPRLYLRLALVARETSALKPGRYRITDDSPPTGSDRMRPGIVSLAEAPFAAYLLFRADRDFRMEQALLAHLRVEPLSQSSRVLERRWKQVVVLRYDPDARLYVEAKRVELGEEHVVLAHSSVSVLVKDYLDKVTSSPVRGLTYADNPTVPPQWAAFLGVRVTGIHPFEGDELLALVPAVTTNILLEGGLSLPFRLTWHVSSPPGLTVISLTDRPSEAIMERLGSPDETQIQLGGFNRSATWNLGDQSLTPGDYRVKVLETGRARGRSVTASSTLRLRSGDSPRVAPPLAIGYVVQAGASDWPLTAREIPESYPGAVLRGSQLLNWSEVPPAAGDIEGVPETVASGEEEESDAAVADASDPDGAQTSRGGLGVPVCAERRHHYWLLPPAEREPHGYQELLGRCRDCGIERWFHTRRRGRRAAKTVRDFEFRTAAAIPLPPRATHLSLSGDDLLDALTFVQHGNDRQLLGIIEQLDVHESSLDETTRVLSALGHMDLAFSPDHRHLEQWAITGPTICELSQGQAILVGARSYRIMERVREDVEAMGGMLAVERQDPAPSRILLANLSLDALKEVADSTSAALNIPLALSSNVSDSLVARLPRIWDLLPSLTRERWPDLPAERFDLQALKWRPVFVPSEPGAYRFGKSPRVYGFVDHRGLQQRELALADHRTVKHLAGALAQRPLLAYGVDSQSLQVPLGAELPGVFERAVVLASGTAPRKRIDGVVQYDSVPARLAGTLWILLGGTRANH